MDLGSVPNIRVVAPGPGDLMLSGLHGHQACTRYISRLADKTLVHIQSEVNVLTL